MEKFNLPIEQEDLKILAEGFEFALPKSKFNLEDLDSYMENDPVIFELFEGFIKSALAYVVDVCAMEKQLRDGSYIDSDDYNIDSESRRILHNSMITSINIFNRYIVTNKYHKGFVTWDPSNRVAYGNFAIIHIMNILRDQILLEKMKMIDVVDIDFEKLKNISSHDDLLVIEFVDIISNALKDDREMTAEEKGRMESISKELSMNEEYILERFHQIYINSYK